MSQPSSGPLASLSGRSNSALSPSSDLRPYNRPPSPGFTMRRNDEDFVSQTLPLSSMFSRRRSSGSPLKAQDKPSKDLPSSTGPPTVQCLQNPESSSKPPNSRLPRPQPPPARSILKNLQPSLNRAQTDVVNEVPQDLLPTPGFTITRSPPPSLKSESFSNPLKFFKRLQMSLTTALRSSKSGPGPMKRSHCWFIVAGVNYCRQRSLFSTYTPLKNCLAKGIEVLGIGTVVLTVRSDNPNLPPKCKDYANQARNSKVEIEPKTWTTMTLHDVLHIPDAMSNGFNPMNLSWARMYQDVDIVICDEEGSKVAWCEKVLGHQGLCLSGETKLGKALKLAQMLDEAWKQELNIILEDEEERRIQQQLGVPWPRESPAVRRVLRSETWVVLKNVAVVKAEVERERDIEERFSFGSERTGSRASWQTNATVDGIEFGDNEVDMEEINEKANDEDADDEAVDDDSVMEGVETDDSIYILRNTTRGYPIHESSRYEKEDLDSKSSGPINPHLESSTIYLHKNRRLQSAPSSTSSHSFSNILSVQPLISADGPGEADADGITRLPPQEFYESFNASSDSTTPSNNEPLTQDKSPTDDALAPLVQLGTEDTTEPITEEDQPRGPFDSSTSIGEYSESTQSPTSSQSTLQTSRPKRVVKFGTVTYYPHPARHKRSPSPHLGRCYDWFILPTSKYNYARDREAFATYIPLTDCHTNSGSELAVHGIGTVNLKVIRRREGTPEIVTLKIRNVLHIPKADCNGFNPSLNPFWDRVLTQRIPETTTLTGHDWTLNQLFFANKVAKDLYQLVLKESEDQKRGSPISESLAKGKDIIISDLCVTLSEVAKRVVKMEVKEWKNDPKQRGCRFGKFAKDMRAKALEKDKNKRFCRLGQFLRSKKSKALEKEQRATKYESWWETRIACSVRGCER